MKLAIFTVGVVVFWASPALAYIDPGSGSAIMSAIIGFFVAIALGIKTYWYKIKSIFTKKKNISKKEDGQEISIDKSSGE